MSGLVDLNWLPKEGGDYGDRGGGDRDAGDRDGGGRDGGGRDGGDAPSSTSDEDAEVDMTLLQVKKSEIK